MFHHFGILPRYLENNGFLLALFCTNTHKICPRLLISGSPKSLISQLWHLLLVPSPPVLITHPGWPPKESIHSQPNCNWAILVLHISCHLVFSFVTYGESLSLHSSRYLYYAKEMKLFSKIYPFIWFPLSSDVGLVPVRRDDAGGE